MHAPRFPPLRVAVRVLLGLLITVLILSAVELVLRLAGVRPVYSERDPYVGFASNIPLFVEETDPSGATFLVTAPNKLPWFNRQRFAKVKPAGTTRIFCVGGSTTYGRPYDDTTSFAGWLRAMLPAADPSHAWEVINAGGISYASYRVALLMEELARYQPDLFIIYSGQNEFLERRTYAKAFETPRAVRGLGASLGRTRLYAALQAIVGRRSAPPAAGSSPATDSPSGASADGAGGIDVLPAEVQTILEESVGPEAYVRDDALREKVLAHYRFNLDRMVDIARSAGARVIFVVPASNLADCSPFKSEHGAGLTEEEIRRVDDDLVEAEHAEREGRLADALAQVDEALRMDDRYAKLHYLRGRLLRRLGRAVEAKSAFTRALDEDVCPLRALTPMAKIVTDVATQRHAGLVDFRTIVEAHSPDAIPGGEIFLDHVHPTIEGNHLLATSLLETMADEGLVHVGPQWDAAARERVKETVLGRVDRQAQGRALRNLAKVLNWAGKTEEANELARRAVALLPEDAEALDARGVILEREGRLEDAVEAFEQALKIDPDFVQALINISGVLARQGRTEEARDHLQHALRLSPEDARAYNTLGIVLVELGEREKALAAYQHAIELRPDDPKVYNNLGNLYSLEKDYERAQQAFARALQIEPEYADAQYGMGLVLVRERRIQEARTYFENAVRIRPEHAQAHYSLGLVLAQEGSFELAVQQMERALEIDPDYEDAKTNLARVRALMASGGRE
jgi:Flp pilus assembly protein TadD